MSKFSSQDRQRLESVASREERALGTIVRMFTLRALSEYEQSLQSTGTGPSPALPAIAPMPATAA